MNKFLTAFLLFTIISVSSGLSLFADSVKNEDSPESSSAGWAFYSEGLLYRSQAGAATTVEDRNNFLDKAIERFLKAVESGDTSARVFNQLADSYFIKGDADRALEFAGKAIESDKEFFSPYNIIYGIKMSRNDFKAAAEIMERYHDVNPEDPYTLYLLGVHYFRYLNDADKSLDAFQKVIFISETAAMPSYYLENSYYNCGYILHSKGHFQEALYYFKKSFELNENNSTALYMVAVSAMNHYNLDEAEKHALLFLQRAPGNQNMEYILGRLYYIKGNPAAFQYLIKIKDSNSFEGLLSMALYSELTGEDDKAEKILNAIVKHRSDFISPYIALGRRRARKDDGEGAYNAFIAAGTNSFRSGLFDVAEKLFYRALELKGENNPDLYYYIARTHEENRNFALSISYYKRYYEFTGEINILIHIGYLYASRDQFKRAHEYYDKAAKIEPANPSVYFFKGLTYIWESNYKKGEATLRKAISLQEGEEGYYFYLAVALEKQNRFKETVAALEKAIEYNPRSARSMNYLGYLYAEKNINIDEAHRLIRTALDLEPDNGAYLDSMGWVYFRKGEFETALKYLLLAEERLDGTDSPDPVVFEHIGDTYEKLGNTRKAVFYWERSIEMEKNSAIEAKIKKALSNEGK